MKSKLILLTILGLAANVVLADSDRDYAYNATCPANAQVDMDAKFGAGTSAITQCIYKRHDIRVAINMSTNVLNPKSGISQTLNNVNNMIANYEGMYGLTLGEGYRIAIVAHFAGGRFLLSDAAYNRSFNVTTGNPSRAAVEALVAKGIPIYMCQNTMSGNNWVTADLIPGVQEAPAGVVAITDFGMRGWVVLTP
jgi:intracellular sulfur oxidation DsrE/DsrF family protein